MKARGPHDLTTVRRLATVSRDVSDSQILDVATAAPVRLVQPAPRRPGPTLSDLVTLDFFDKGLRQEATGTYTETEHVPIHSLDHVPRGRGPMLLALFLVTTAAGAGGWWLALSAFATLGLLI